jgi:AAA+ ATPase superfamily predicted ATPase
VEVYGVLGGVPGYISRWNGKKSLKENVCRNILSPNGYLFDEVEHYLGMELRELSLYSTILASIAAGNNKLNDLYHQTGFSRAKISVYMKNLMEFEVIEKVVSFETGGWENAKKGVYRIQNTYVNFWFRFIYPHLSDLYMLSPEEFYDRYIEQELNEYMNRYFIQVCTEYLNLLNMIDKLPIHLHRIGTWVGKQGNIDIIAQNSVRESVVGLCNWFKPELTMEDCQSLIANMKKARISAEYYYLFSATGFGASLVEASKEDSRYVLIDMKEL